MARRCAYSKIEYVSGLRLRIFRKIEYAYGTLITLTWIYFGLDLSEA